MRSALLAFDAFVVVRFRSPVPFFLPEDIPATACCDPLAEVDALDLLFPLTPVPVLDDLLTLDEDVGALPDDPFCDVPAGACSCDEEAFDRDLFITEELDRGGDWC